jgi:hypothetical protein
VAIDRLRDGIWSIHGAEQPAPHAMFGLAGAIPVVGDFNGDGKDEIGIFYKGEWFLDLNGNGRWDAEDLWAKLGSDQDKPVTGDWDGDGKDDIGIYGPEWPGDAVQRTRTRHPIRTTGSPNSTSRKTCPCA